MAMNTSFHGVVYSHFRQNRFRAILAILEMNPVMPPSSRLAIPIIRNCIHWTMRIWFFFFSRPIPAISDAPTKAKILAIMIVFKGVILPLFIICEAIS